MAESAPSNSGATQASVVPAELVEAPASEPSSPTSSPAAGIESSEPSGQRLAPPTPRPRANRRTGAVAAEPSAAANPEPPPRERGNNGALILE
jgi:hypothetical protein